MVFSTVFSAGCRRLLTAAFLLSVVLIRPSGGHADTQSCESLFRPSAVVSLHPHADFKTQIQSGLDSIRTANDAVSFWRSVRVSVEQSFAMENEVLRALVMTDFALPLVRVRKEFTADQRRELLQIARELAPSGYGNWRRGLVPMLIVLNGRVPEDSFSKIAEDNWGRLIAEESYPRDFNIATVTALNTLAEPERAKVQEFYRETYFDLRRSAKADDKEIRRNVELINRALYENEFQQMWRTLSAADRFDVDELDRIVGHYWASMQIEPAYPFAMVATIARDVQRSLGKVLSTGRAVYLYGSLVNGKAQFPGSDVDLRLDAKLEERYIQTFGEMQTFAKLGVEMKTDPAAVELQNALDTAERRIAERLNLRRGWLIGTYRKARLLTIMSGRPLFGPRDLFAPMLILQYNPIRLKILHDKIMFQVFDAYGTQAIHEIEMGF